mgnify:CR=1 FL=1
MSVKTPQPAGMRMLSGNVRYCFQSYTGLGGGGVGVQLDLATSHREKAY